MDIQSFCLDQLARYPRLKTQDLVKALYQREFGCGHLISDLQKGLDRLMEEFHCCQAYKEKNQPLLVESLGGSFCRVHLQAAVSCGLSAGTLFRLFAQSAAPAGSMASFIQQLDMLEALIHSGDIPLIDPSARQFLQDYRHAGCPATHHSEAFRQAYRPAYRVIRSGYARFLDLFAAIDKLLISGNPAIIAIEGSSATGKSTLADLLSRIYDCNVLHMDDFFLQLHQRTPERFTEPGGNVDYERFREEVLLPLQAQKPFSYRPFSCSTMSLAAPIHVVPRQLSIVEGAYSMHPALSDAYDLSVFLKIDAQIQEERILHRNGCQMQQRFLNEWIPLEKRYFGYFHIENQCSMSIDVT